MNRHIIWTSYDQLYDKASEVIKEHDPCRIQRGEDGTISCIDSRRAPKDVWDYKTATGPTLCCTGCKHLSEQGCTAKSLDCRLWLCRHARYTNPEVARQLHDIHKEAMDIGVPVGFYRMSKEQVMRRVR